MTRSFFGLARFFLGWKFELREGNWSDDDEWRRPSAGEVVPSQEEDGPKDRLGGFDQ